MEVLLPFFASKGHGYYCGDEQVGIRIAAGFGFLASRLSPFLAFPHALHSVAKLAILA